MINALEDHEGTVSIGGRTITNLRFADDIDGLAGDEAELAKLVERLDKTSTTYGVEISAEKTKLMTNNTSGINTEIKINGQKPETVTSFKYLGSVITDECSKPEILSRIAQTTAELTRLKPVWNDKSISLSSKIQLMCSFVTSIFLYACESWTLTAELQRRIQAVEMRCYRKILRISYKDHVTNEEVRAKIQQAIGPHEDIPTIVQRRIPQCYGHVSRSSDRARTILQGTVEGERRRHQGMDRPGVHQVPEGSGEQEKMEETDCEITSDAQVTLAVKGLMMMMMNDCTYGYSSKNKQTYKQTTTTATTRKQKQTKTTIN